MKGLGLSTRDKQHDGISEERNQSPHNGRKNLFLYFQKMGSFQSKSQQPGSFIPRRGKEGEWVALVQTHFPGESPGTKESVSRGLTDSVSVGSCETGSGGCYGCCGLDSTVRSS